MQSFCSPDTFQTNFSSLLLLVLNIVLPILFIDIDLSADAKYSSADAVDAISLTDNDSEVESEDSFMEEDEVDEEDDSIPADLKLDKDELSLVQDGVSGTSSII